MQLAGERDELMGISFRHNGTLGYCSGLDGGTSSSNISVPECSDSVNTPGQNSLQM